MYPDPVSPEEISRLFRAVNAFSEQLSLFNKTLDRYEDRQRSLRSRHYQKDSYTNPERHDDRYHYPRRRASPSRVKTIERPSGSPLANSEISKPLDDVLVPSIQETPFVREIEQPREAPLEVVEPMTLHLTRETPDVVIPPLILVEIPNPTVVERQVVSNDDEVSTKMSKVQQGQVEIVSLKIDDIQLNVNHTNVVGKEGSANTIVEHVVDITWRPLHHGPNDHRWDNQRLVHVATTWVAIEEGITWQVHRLEIDLVGGSMYLETPFDPGISGIQ